MANKISVIIDVAVDKANAGLSGFKQALGDADGSVGKFKAGASSAFSSIQANAGALAVGAGGALVAFGAKSISAFQDLALESAHLSDALGMPVEDASRLIEVAGDLGISSDTLEASIGKMNVAASKTPKAFEDIGAAIAKNADGTTNVNQTFLNAVDSLNKIPDATKRAEAAQKIFGKGWKDMAELIGQGSDEIVKSLGEVSDAKVIDEEEVEKARRLRASMDNLNDAIEDVQLAVGEALVPALADAVDGLMDVKSAIESIDGVVPDAVGGLGGLWDSAKSAINPVSGLTKSVGALGDMFGIGGDKADENAAATDGLTSSTQLVNDAIQAAIATQQAANAEADETQAELDATAAAERLAAEMAGLLAQKTDEFNRRYDEMRGKLDSDQALLNLGASFDEVAAKAAATAAAIEAGGEGSEAAMRDQALAQIDLKNAVIDYAEQVGDIPTETVTRINAEIDAGDLALAENQLTILTRNRDANIRIIANGGAGYGGLSGARAGGGPVSAGDSYVVGENGPEIVTPTRAGFVHPNGESMRAGSSVTNNYYTTIMTMDVVGAAHQQALMAWKAGAR